MTMSTGFQVLNRHRQVTADLAERFRSIPVSTASDSMNRMTAGGASLRAMHSGALMSGPALTVKTRPGDNLMVHLALDLAAPGDVVVVDAGGDVTNAIIGELMVMHASARKLGGIVIFGAIRDSAAIRAQNLPVFALGVTHRGPYKDGPGEINAAIAINGMVIVPGDLIIGDPDGVLAVPFDEAEIIYAAAHAKNEHELRQAVKLQDGTSDRSAIRARAISLGITFESPAMATGS